MKTATTREFYHTPSLVKSMRPGQTVVVTDAGKPSFTVIKAGTRPKRTLEDFEREARAIFPDKRPPVNLTEIMKRMKQ